MNGEPIFFKGWSDIGRTALLCLCTYAGFILLLRASGKRTLTKMNVFDFVFVVALGSILATTIVSRDTTVIEGLVASGTLIIMQYVISWLAVRSRRLEKIVNGEPVLLLFRGELIKENLKRERLTPDEIRAAIRAEGLASMEQVHAVILETDGSLSIVSQGAEKSSNALADVRWDQEHLKEQFQ